MVVTRRTPVVPPPPLARNHSQGAQRPPPRASLAKDIAGFPKNAPSGVAVASFAGSSNGNKDHHSGLVSTCLLCKLKLFRPLSSGWMLSGPLFLPDHSSWQFGLDVLRLCSRLEGLTIFVTGQQLWKEVQEVQETWQGKYSLRSIVISFLTALRTNTNNPTSKPSSTSSPNYFSSRSPSTRFPCAHRIHTSNLRYVAA